MRRSGMGTIKNIHSYVKIFASLSSSLRIFRTFSACPFLCQNAEGVARKPKPPCEPSGGLHNTGKELASGIKINAMNQCGLIGACTVMFQVGSRDEAHSQLGVTHFLRAGSTTNGECNTGFLRTRYLQTQGGYITVSTDRQTVSLTLRCPTYKFSDLKDCLVDCSLRCLYADHELADIRKIIREDLDRRHPEERVLDLLQKACFSGPLSNSIYCERERIDSVNSTTIRSYVDGAMKSNQCSIGSCGFLIDEVKRLADDLRSETKRHEGVTRLSCPKSGYEFYDEGPVATTYMALGIPGISYVDYHCCLLHALVAVSCGYASDHPWPNKFNVRDYTPHQPIYKAFNISYSDTGIFGVMVKTPSENAFKAGALLARFFKSLNNLTPENVYVGKKRLMLAIHLNNAECVPASMGLAQMALCGVHFKDTYKLVSYVQAVSVQDVLQVAASLADRCTQGVVGVAVVGDIGQAPNDVDFMQFLINLTLPMTRTLYKGGKEKPKCPPPEYGPPQVHRTNYNNGLRIAATKQHGPIGACTVMFQVGSMHEFDHQLGVTHFLRAGSTCNSQASSGFIKTRYLQQKGAYISVKTDRQNISYTLRCATPTLNDVSCYLVDAGARCEFFEHELGNIKKMVRADLKRRPPQEHVLDLVQRACFRGPHSNSIYCEEGRINSMSSKSIIEYIGTYFKTNICVIGVCGFPIEEIGKLVAYIDCSRTPMPAYNCPVVSCPRGGYEYFDYGPGGETYIALAVPGSGMCDTCCYLQHAILAAACGLGYTTMGSHTCDRTPQPPLGLQSDDDIFTDYTAFNIGYQDTGLFGILVKTHGDQVRCAAFRAAEFFGQLQCLTCDQIEVGKKRLQVGVQISHNYCESMSESLAYQLAYNVRCDSAQELCDMIQSVPAESVIQVANSISSKRCSGQMGVAVVGDVAAAPDDGELRCV